MRDNILQYVKKEYGTLPEYPWASTPTHAVLRHALLPGEKKGKWYGVIMNIRRSTLGLEGEGNIEILNVKCNPEMLSMLCMSEGYLPGYHMNKNSWISVLLDGTVPLDNIKQLLDDSYEITASAKSKAKMKRFGPRDWIVPANPKYYDLIAAFQENEEIDWKQSSDVRVGDTIYMYVAAPYSAIMYKCKATEVNMPYNYESKELTVKKAMKIRLQCQYEPDFMPFERLKNEFGVYAVRGPRNMPNSLKYELDMYEGNK